MVILSGWGEVSHKREISCCPAFVGSSFSLSDSTQIMQKNDFSLNDYGIKIRCMKYEMLPWNAWKAPYMAYI